MNKAYRNVWCAKTGTFIAAAETAKAKGKSARSGVRVLTCAALLTLGGVAGGAHAGALDGGSTLAGIDADVAYGNGAQTTNAAGGKSAVAIGQNASANNLSGATPNADGTVAVGDSASATDGGVAVGGASYAGSISTAVGAGATAATANSVALGANSVANSTTLGTAGFAPVGGTAISAATAAGEVSIGKAGAERRITNVAAGLNPTDAVNVSQLMSEDAKVNNISNNLSNVINGGGIKYFHSNSTLADSTASGTNSVAIGGEATATAANSVALGANSLANSTTLGSAGFAPVSGTVISGATAAGEVSVGAAGAERRITNVAAGLNPTDAVNVSQLMSEDAKVNNISNNLSNLINGGGIKYFHVNSTQVDSVATGTDSLALGPNAYATGPYAIAMGSASTATSGNSIALGKTSMAAAANSIALGTSSTAAGITSIALGPSSNAATQGAVAIGNNATVSNAVYSVAIGNGASAIGPGGSDANQSLAMGYLASVTGNARAMALGAAATASGSGSVAIGGSASASASNSVALGNASTTTANLGAAGYNPGSGTLSGTASAANGEVSVGSAGKERRITNVAAGSAATDAVNVSQLQSEAAKVNAQGAATAAALGGGSTYNSTTGAITNPTYVVGGNTINNIAGAISNIDARTTQNASSITNIDARTTQNSSDITNLVTAINDGDLGLVQQDATTRNITVAKATDGTIVDFTGAAGTRKLTGVLAGNVSASSVDAVNGSQLYSLANATANAIGGGSTVNSDGSISAPSYVIGGTTMNSIAGTITNIDARTTQNSSEITSIDARTTQIAGDVTNLDARTTQMSSEITNLTTAINSGDLGLVQQDDTTRNITVAKTTDGTIVDFTGTAGARKLTGVLAGNVNASSVDAVNGSQLYSLANATASAIGGGSTVNSDGSISAPSYVIGGTTMNSIAGTITNIDARTTQNSSDITSIDARTTQIAGDVTNLDARTTQMSSEITNLTTAINSGDLGLVQQDDTTRNITVAKTTDGTIVDFTGTAGARKLTGVLAGNVSASSVDAVNGSQLYSVANSTASAIGGGSTVNSDGSISKPSYVIGGTTVNSIGGAVTNIDARTTQLANDVTNLTTSINNGALGGLVEQDTTTRNIAVAKTTDGTIVDFTGTSGGRKLTGVLAGNVSASSADAVNGSQLYNVANSTASAIGGGSTVNSDGSISAPSYVIGGTTMNSIGGAIANIDARTTQNASDISSINTALSNITSNGTGIKYFHTNSMLADSQATGSESVAIGGAAVSTGANSVALGSNSVANRANTVSVGSAGAERQITNVAAGTADTDAVNVAQLKATGLVNTNGTTKAAVTYDNNADGSVNYGSVTMGNGAAGGTMIHNVAAGTTDTDAVNVAQMNSALANVTNIAMNAASGSPTFATNGDGSTAAAKATGHHATAMGSNAQASADNSVALGADSVADRENTVSVGSKGKERQIVNVAAGTQGTDAVNVDQLNETVAGAVGNLPAGMSSKDYTDQRFNSMQNTVNQVAKNSYAGVAAAMAMPNMTPSQPGNTVVAAGAGSYKSGAALGVGATYRSRNSKWLVNGAVSVTSTGDAGVRAQVGYEF